MCSLPRPSGDSDLRAVTRQEQTLPPSYYRTISYAYGKHVKLKWAGVPVNNVDSLDVKAWAASITRNGSSATVVNRAVGILAGILVDAVEHQHWLSIRHLGSNVARSRRSHRNVTSISPKTMCAGWPRSLAVTPTIARADCRSMIDEADG